MFWIILLSILIYAWWDGLLERWGPTTNSDGTPLFIDDSQLRKAAKN